MHLSHVNVRARFLAASRIGLPAESTACKASAARAVSCGGYITPSTPLVKVSCTPPARGPQTDRPLAIASRYTNGKPSVVHEEMNMSALAYALYKSFPLWKPVNKAFHFNLSWSSILQGPSPITQNLATLSPYFVKFLDSIGQVINVFFVSNPANVKHKGKSGLPLDNTFRRSSLYQSGLYVSTATPLTHSRTPLQPASWSCFRIGRQTGRWAPHKAKCMDRSKYSSPWAMPSAPGSGYAGYKSILVWCDMDTGTPST